MFETLTRRKIRFATPKGQLSIEDIWDLPLTGGALSLDDVAKKLSKELRDSEESFVNPTKKDKVSELKLNAVVYIINVKIDEREAAKEAVKKRARKAQILEILESKELEKLNDRSAKELRKELKELEKE